MIVYRHTSVVEVIGVLHGKRDLAPILGERLPAGG
jgi:hypothetical protein